MRQGQRLHGCSCYREEGNRGVAGGGGKSRDDELIIRKLAAALMVSNIPLALAYTYVHTYSTCGTASHQILLLLLLLLITSNWKPYTTSRSVVSLRPLSVDHL